MSDLLRPRAVSLMLAYVATIPAANYLIGHIGTTCVANGPCLVPVAPGIYAPSGVIMIGAALVLRDLIQRRCGALTSLACIAIGAVVSTGVASPTLALASGAAFIFSELVDFAVYAPLARNRFAVAVLLSCIAGAIVDSALFLWLAFGSLSFIGGQIVGKFYAAIAYLTVRFVAQRLRSPNRVLSAFPSCSPCNLGFHKWTHDSSKDGRRCAAWGGWAEVCERCGKTQSGSNRQ